MIIIISNNNGSDILAKLKTFLKYAQVFKIVHENCLAVQICTVNYVEYFANS